MCQNQVCQYPRHKCARQFMCASVSVCAVGQHGLPITHASFFPGRSTSLAVTVDRRGRVVSHVLANNLLLMRTTVASKPALDGSLGVISSLVHLTPFYMSSALLGGGSGKVGKLMAVASVVGKS